jgi:hypothetical protein
MRDEIFSNEQKKLLPLLKSLSDKFYLIGGTAIALHLGHRRSIDFDLATSNDLDIEGVRSEIRQEYKINSTIVEAPMELTIVVDSVKMTFLKYPFNIEVRETFKDIISLPDLLTLSAMKAATLGRRAKWKDYVDLYFIFKSISLAEVSRKAEEIFAGEFNEKLFREQLSYFKDIDYTEEVEYLPGFEVQDDEVKKSLTEISLEK